MRTGMNEKDWETINKQNRRNYDQYGYSPATLGWNKGKQDIRFDILTSFFELNDKSVMDVGCGFGDLLPFLRKIGWGGQYTGYDITSEFVKQAQKFHMEDKKAVFKISDFLNEKAAHEADIILASGTFNYKFRHTDNYGFIRNCFHKAYQLAGEGIAFNFLSDKVDWKYDHAWYSNPSVILEIAYEISRNVALRNDYMPFEFSVAIYKDDSFEKEDTLFNRYKALSKYYDGE